MSAAAKSEAQSTAPTPTIGLNQLDRKQTIGALALALGAVMTIASTATAGWGVLILWIGFALMLRGSLILRWGGGFIAALLVAAVGMSIGGHTGTRAVSPKSGADSVAVPTRTSPVRPTLSWQEVKRWSGSGIKQTETFSIASREWRINWKSSKEAFPGAGIFQIFVHDENGGIVSLAANKQGTGADESYVRAAPGQFYLMINSGNVDWLVTVEDRR